MGVVQRVIKPRTQRAKRELEKKAPQIIENTKQCLFFHGHNTSDDVRKCLKDLYAIKRPDSQHFRRKNDILPFEDSLPVERLSQKHDVSLFCMANHTKKRPHNLLMGRLFDHHILDIVELGLQDYLSLADFKNAKISQGTKPCMVFCGALFDEVSEFKVLKNLLIDFFRGFVATEIRLQGFEHALQFTAIDGKVLMRSYRILMKKSGTRIPRVELEEIGPSMTLVLRRHRLASDDLRKTACRIPKQLKDNKVKNKKKDVFGTKLGRVHMTKQDMAKLQTRKMKGLKKKVSAKNKSKPAGKEQMDTTN